MSGDDLKAAWGVAPPFPIASKPGNWQIAVALALQAPNPKAAALIYAKYGIPVIPCNPIETGEFSKAAFVSIYAGSIDPAQIEEWWTKYPDALIGCPIGRRTGVFVVDIDSPEFHEHDGIKKWQLLELEYQETVITRQHVTAGKGYHLLFLWDERRPIGTSPGDLPRGGMEVKGEGGQVILPGSVLRDGRRYSAGNGFVSRAPVWLLDILSPTTAATQSRPQTRNGSWNADYVMGRLKDAEAGLREAGDGVRNSAAGRWAMPIGHMAGGGAFDGLLTVDQVRDRLADVASANAGGGSKFVNDGLC
jgi:hypothetical protein